MRKSDQANSNRRNSEIISRRTFVANAALIGASLSFDPGHAQHRQSHRKPRLGAVHVELTPADLREIETASAATIVHGGRMNEEQMKVVEK